MAIKQIPENSKKLRKNSEEITQNFTLISKDQEINQLINAVPLSAAIVNEYRQIIYFNETLLKVSDSQITQEIIGRRPGEIMQCKYSDLGHDLCGTDIHGKVCGALNAIKESQEYNIKTTKETRLTTKKNGDKNYYDLIFTVSPFTLKE